MWTHQARFQKLVKKIYVPIVRFQPKLTCCTISYALEYQRPINTLLRRKEKNPNLQHGASLVAQMVKNLPARQETWVQSLGWGDPPEEIPWQPTPVFLPGEIHRQRSRVGYSSRGHKGLNTTEQLKCPNFRQGAQFCFCVYSIARSEASLESFVMKLSTVFCVKPQTSKTLFSTVFKQLCT